MLEFTDATYEFFPAKPNSLVLWLGRLFNRRRNLPGHRHLISDVEVRGNDRLDEARRLGGNRWFFLVNHSTHSDAQILAEAQRIVGVRSCYMAAYDVFLRSKLQAWVMQHAGCFSVNRDASDSRSMREAIRILLENRYGLTLFPEGNVYLMNDRV
ncbi:MAG: 1-acyl-sn-glycerol-3-phosphate acyltransferase, partial [Verrucomicrobiales bacterium]